MVHASKAEDALRQVEVAIDDFRRIIEQIGQFDLTVSLGHSQDIYGQRCEAISRTLDDALENLRAILSAVVKAVAATHRASDSIQRSTEAISVDMAEQASHVAAATGAVTDMTAMLNQNSTQAEPAHAGSVQTYRAMAPARVR